jgi:flagellar hook-length control protein FliK
MKTSAISNLPNLGSSSGSTPKQSEAAGDMPFAKALSREMTARPKTGEKPTAAREDSRPKQASRAEAKPENAKAAEESPASSPAEDGASVGTVDNTAPLKSDRTTIPVDHLRDEEEVILSTASSELLALVSSLQPVSGRAELSGDSGLAGKDDGVRLHGLEPKGTDLPTDGQALNLPVAPQAATIPPPIAAPEQIPTTAARAGEAVAVDIAKVAPDTRTGTGTGIEQGIDPRAIVRPETDSRAGDESAGKDSAGSQDFNAQLMQAKNEKTNPGNSTELTGQKSFIDTATPRVPQDMQPAAPPSIQIGPTLPARMHQVQSVPPNIGDRLAPQVGAPGWDQALGQKVTWMIGGEQQSASLTLNPPDLGPLQIELKVENSLATASFTAAQPEVRQALEAAMPKLRDMLGEAGIQLGQTSVSAGTPNNQQNAFGQSPQPSHRSGSMTDDGDAPVQVGSSQIISGGQGLVDTFA